MGENFLDTHPPSHTCCLWPSVVCLVTPECVPSFCCCCIVCCVICLVPVTVLFTLSCVCLFVLLFMSLIMPSVFYCVFFLNCFVCCGGSVRALGTAAVDMCQVAVGGADAYYHIGMHCWDIAASAIIVQEAGGVVTDTDGACGCVSSRHSHSHSQLREPLSL